MTARAPHPFVADPNLPADHRGRRVCAACHLLGEAGDPRHAMPDAPGEPDYRERAAGGGGLMGRCHVCPADVPDGELADHLRVLHPDLWGDGPQRWPDGEPVVVDATLEPDDFDRG